MFSPPSSTRVENLEFRPINQENFHSNLVSRFKTISHTCANNYCARTAEQVPKCYWHFLKSHSMFKGLMGAIDPHFHFHFLLHTHFHILCCSSTFPYLPYSLTLSPPLSRYTTTTTLSSWTRVHNNASSQIVSPITSPLGACWVTALFG